MSTEFKKVKTPPRLTVNENCWVGPTKRGTAYLKVGFGEVDLGPRAAILLARWLIRYARWSSLK